MTWHVADIDGRPVRFGGPAGAARGLVFLAGLGGESPAGDPAWEAALASAGMACAVADGGPAWWCDRPCPAFHPSRTAERWLVESLVPACLARWGVSAVALAGLDAGGQGALRSALKHPATFRVVAALDAAVDHFEWVGRGTPLDDLYDSKEQCRQDSATLHIHPSRQPPHVWFACDPASPWHRGNDRLHEKLTALGVPHTADLSTRRCTGSACLRSSSAEVVPFVAAGLDREARRLM